MTEHVIFNLAETIKKHYERRKSWDGLSIAIKNANNNQGTIHRGKLPRLCNGDDTVTLTINELRILDQYLKQFDEGLAENPIFTRTENILDSFIEAENVQFIVTAKFYEDFKTEVLSRWDMKAIIELESRLSGVDLDIYDISPYQPNNAVNESIINEQSTAQISIGSPLVNYASEFFLAGIFKMNPYSQRNVVFPPFYLFYPEVGSRNVSSSSFILNKKECKKLLGEQKFEGHFGGVDRRGIIIGDDIYTDGLEDINHAVLIAQRQGKYGNVRMVLCGLSGPATFGLAKVIASDQITKKLPDFDSNKIQPVLIALIEVDISYENSRLQKDKREVRNQKLISKIKLFNYVDGQWKCQNY